MAVDFECAPRPDSFLFAGVDMLETYGVRCVAYDVLLPKARARKVTLPMRDGAYDFGAQYYEERQVKLDCDSLMGLSRRQLREAAHLLSKKAPLVLWDEPDKYYVGQLENSAALSYLGRLGHAFTLTFVCDPFAYGRTVQEAIGGRMTYGGTARTPTRIEIYNAGSAAVQGVRIRMRRRME